MRMISHSSVKSTVKPLKDRKLMTIDNIQAKVGMLISNGGFTAKVAILLQKLFFLSFSLEFVMMVIVLDFAVVIFH